MNLWKCVKALIGLDDVNAFGKNREEMMESYDL